MAIQKEDLRFYLIWSNKHRLYISRGKIYKSQKMAESVIRRIGDHENLEVHVYKVNEEYYKSITVKVGRDEVS